MGGTAKLGVGGKDGTAKLAVVAGSVISALLAAVALRLRVATRVRGAAEIR
ncbi:MAG: hypothetical protein Q4G64_00465 [bacterium]|nr:hypothetical protein [bacterium]